MLEIYEMDFIMNIVLSVVFIIVFFVAAKDYKKLKNEEEEA